MRVKSRVGPKGQVVIPKELRDEFKLAPGDEVMFDAEEHAIVIHPRVDPKKFVDEFVSIVKHKKKLPENVDWDELYYSQFE
jgi:AbrB family looped-hinge helix DNA binding protein